MISVPGDTCLPIPYMIWAHQIALKLRHLNKKVMSMACTSIILEYRHLVIKMIVSVNLQKFFKKGGLISSLNPYTSTCGQHSMHLSRGLLYYYCWYGAGTLDRAEKINHTESTCDLRLSCMYRSMIAQTQPKLLCSCSYCITFICMPFKCLSNSKQVHFFTAG